MNNYYDILIVGAGMVGTSLAISLASLPLRIALVETAPIKTVAQFDHDSRSLALTYGSVQILQSLNIWQNLKEHAIPIQMVHVSDRGHFGVTRIKASEENVPALGYVIPAPILGVELNKALLHLSTIDIFNPAKIENLTAVSSEEHESWMVELTTEQGKQTIDAKLIVAADGSNSTIRQLQNISITEKDYQQSAIATTVTLKHAHHNVAYERFIQQGAIACLPLMDNRIGLVLTADNSLIHTLQTLNDADFLQQAQYYFGYRLGQFLQLGKRHIYPLKQMVVEEQVRKGLVLLGNAAHTLHPIAAQGFNLGLMDVNLLTKAITDAITQHEDIAALSTLQIYQQSTVRAQQKIMQLTDSLTHLFAHDFLPLTFARNASLLTLDILPTLKHRLAKRLMGMKV